jgi:hypothetical protein
LSASATSRRRRGRTVEQAAADLLASLATDEGIELTEEQEAAIEAADAEIDRGEFQGIEGSNPSRSATPQ